MKLVVVDMSLPSPLASEGHMSIQVLPSGHLVLQPPECIIIILEGIRPMQQDSVSNNPIIIEQEVINNFYFVD